MLTVEVGVDVKVGDGVGVLVNGTFTGTDTVSELLQSPVVPVK
jgi:hypothetical protein